MRTASFDTVDLDRLRSFASAMVGCFQAPLVIGLVGTLGAGKTTLTQAVAAAANVDPEDVTSPTFTLLCSYQARVAGDPIELHHLDAYRIGDEDEFLELGIEELFDAPDAWVLIEWADRFESLMPIDTLWLRIELSTDHPAAGKASTEGAFAEPPRQLQLQTRTDRFDDAIDRLVALFPKPGVK